jgi:hypothetical protein
MEALTYLLKVTACTVFFFGFYLLVLRKLTFFKINRFYLLVTLLLSFIIPALQFEVKREIVVVEGEILTGLPEIKPAAQQPVKFMQPIVVEYQPEVSTKIDWMTLMYGVYGVTASFLLLACLWRLFRLLKYTVKYTKNSDGLKLITKNEGFTNCSFFNYVFIDERALSDADLIVLLKHEQVHARQYHSIDKMMLMLFKSILWFNPIVYLYDKALEQVHEYEADEITSTNFGNQAYANLLLKLAISKSDMPLIHNFVKSPVKARIKMLFHSKSKNMKKLMYLLTLPVALGLFWLFAVQVVYANKRIMLRDKANLMLKGGSLLDDSINVAKAFRNIYAVNVRKGDAILGKHIKVKFLGFRNSELGVLADFNYSKKVYSFEANTNLGKLSSVKIGDSLNIIVNGFSCPAPYHQLRLMVNEISTINNQMLYKWSAKKLPFLYGLNGLRFTYSKIVSIDKDAKYIKRITLNDNNYTIQFDVSHENFINKEINIGDEVSVTFVGEKLVSSKTYFSNQLMELHSRQNKYALKAKKFDVMYYLDQEKAVIDTLKTVKSGTVKVISYSKINGDVKNKISYMENAVMELLNYRLEAGHIEFDQGNNKIIAKNGILKSLDGKAIVKSTLFTFDLTKRSYSAENIEGKFEANVSDVEREKDFLARLNDKVDYVAKDSVKMSKDRSIISLFGNARLFYNEFKLSGSKIVYNKKSNTVFVNDATMLSGDNKVKADSLSFDLNTKKAKLYGSELNR